MITRGDDMSAMKKVATGGAMVAVAFGVLNVASYALTLLAAHRLGPPEYGQFSALMGLLTIASVASLGLQATAARRLASQPTDSAATERHVLAASWKWALAVTAALLVSAPVLHSVLNMQDWGGLVFTALAAGLLTTMGGQAGLLQGEHRWVPLSLVYCAMGLGRLGMGMIGLTVSTTTTSAMAGVAAGAALPVLAAGLALQHRRTKLPPDPASGSGLSSQDVGDAAGLAREVGQSVHLLLAFFVLSNLDALLARAILRPTDAGLFAAGLIVSKAVLFLPQFVVVVAFPSIAREDHGNRAERRALALVMAIGAVATAVVATLPGWALAFAGGAAYGRIEHRLWLFAVSGTLLAAVQLLVYGALARSHRRPVWLIWAACGVLAVVGAALHTSDTLLLAKLLSAAALLVALVGRVSQGKLRPEPVDNV